MQETFVTVCLIFAGMLFGVLVSEEYRQYEERTISEQEYREYSLQYLEDIRNSMLP